MRSEAVTPYIVRPQDRLDVIALAQGLDAAEIWDHPRNAELRADRSPMQLRPGDVLWLPPSPQRALPLAVGQSNLFVGNSIRRVFWVNAHAPDEVPVDEIVVCVMDPEGRPVRSFPYADGVLMPRGGRAFDIEIAGLEGECLLQLRRGELPLEVPVRATVTSGEGEKDASLSHFSTTP